MTSPFISVSELADELAGTTPPAVLDASLILHTATFDGDYRRESGRPRWVAGHIPGSQHVDVASQFSDTTSPLHYTHPEPQAIADELARLGIRKAQHVVVYDSTGTLWAARRSRSASTRGVPPRACRSSRTRRRAAPCGFRGERVHRRSPAARDACSAAARWCR